MNLIDAVLPAKNILVYDVAASSDGALSVLNDFYAMVKKHEDKTINWIFIISTPALDETDNIMVIRVPWVKKNWFFRAFYDYFIAPIIIKKYSADKVISLQNILIPRGGVPQVLYLHQALPFVEYRFSIVDQHIFWIYQNIISRLIFYSIKHASRVVVQTKWMKNSCVARTGIDACKIEVIPPEVDIKPEKFFAFENTSTPTFIYPAMPLIYKNHNIIITACKKLLKLNNICNFKVIFTFDGSENKLSKKIIDDVEKNNLPIEFIGKVNRVELFEWYAKSVLLFPSYLETVGLPLIEAKLFYSPIIAADTLFSREILEGYKKCHFVKPDDADYFSSIMQEYVGKWYHAMKNEQGRM
ncbi:glycosyltransferase [Synergistaceae bacterium OttesenSCG-928-D05]|nr:glycosyltransferase [Synergistaceae bacterium OttesenSCG-928-D05]